MSSQEFHVLPLDFQFRGRHDAAGQRVYEALNALDLVGYSAHALAGDEVTSVTAILGIDEYKVPMTADAGGALSFAEPDSAVLAERLLKASGADALYWDGELAAGMRLSHVEDVEVGVPAPRSSQVVVGRSLPRSELALSTVGQGGGWRVHEDERGLLAVREGEPVELMLGRKMVPAVELMHHPEGYEINLHARAGALPVDGSVALHYWMPHGVRAVPAVAADSPAARLRTELGDWLYGVPQVELEELQRAWPQAATAMRKLGATRTEQGLRNFLQDLGFDPRMVDYARGEPVPEDFERLDGGLAHGLNLSLEEDIASATGVMKLVYRTGWSPAALIGSSLALLGAGVLLHRWMLRSGRPRALWRRAIMFFWYSDAAYYLWRGLRDARRGRKGWGTAPGRRSR